MTDNLHSRLENEILTDTIIRNIYAELSQHNWTLKMLADRADLPYESVKKLVNRKIRRPSFISIWQIANAFGCSVDQLAGKKSPSADAMQQISENTSEIFRILSDINNLADHTL